MPRQAGRKPGQRQLRVGEEIRHALADILGRGDLRDPDLMGRTVTVTEVRISPDLKNATAFVIPLGGEHVPAVMTALRRSAGHLRGLVAQRMQLRHAPILGFEIDRTFDYAERIDRILNRPEVRQDLTAPPEGAGDEALPDGGLG
jgi:ribosome-binding factor A